MGLTFASFAMLLVAGAPMVFVLGVAAALTLVLTTDVPLVVVAQRLWNGLDSFPLMAIPFFILSGLIMEHGGIARAIVGLAAALVGWIRGSLFMVATVTSTFLSGISGSGSADTAAVSSILLPEMRRRGYDIDYSVAVVAAAGALGPIIPPSIIMVVLAMVCDLSVGAMFLGGIVPGLIASAGLMLTHWLYARRDPARYTDAEPFSPARLRQAFLRAIPALVLPVIIVGGIVGGVVTPTEAGVLAVVAGLGIDLLVYRELKLAKLPELMLRTVGISAAVMIIVGTSSIFAWLVAIQDVPGMIAGWFDGAGGSRVLFLLMVNLLMLFVGMCFEEISALVILMPVLMPVAVKLGIDPLHFGLVMSINLSIGLVAPPYGICTFVACAVARRPVGAVARVIWIPLIPLVLVLMLCTYVPEVVLWLPRALT
ncbi:TRAP transporter large permease [Paracraurococcus ruber]|uniref:TRAP transporter large permease protein n=1 Tax=Paracraurococcus ruber TaxID=77675 RepID=A0ABS1CXG7_9PROT|nr:TRAP transporter large permease [Paracraurococcus ruber]MBK1659172.1 C4-dicarboxylate ABC transporter [Paracraurococcus ruber]TDG29237.1 TRAP transporter large permease [Paracraurococcus ruber]